MGKIGKQKHDTMQLISIYTPGGDAGGGVKVSQPSYFCQFSNQKGNVLTSKNKYSKIKNISPKSFWQFKALIVKEYNQTFAFVSEIAHYHYYHYHI